MQELLVVVEQVQAAFEVAEKHGDGLDALGVGQVLEALFADFVGGDAVQTVGLDGQVSLFQLLVAEGQKIAVGIGHGTLPSGTSVQASKQQARQCL
jgi:hypothetical protein